MDKILNELNSKIIYKNNEIDLDTKISLGSIN